MFVKWAILPGPVRPFVDAGAVWRHISGIKQLRSVANAAGVELNKASEFNKLNRSPFGIPSMHHCEAAATRAALFWVSASHSAAK